MNQVIKVCGDPHCEAIYHNTPKKETGCKNCGGKLIEINQKTYWAKYSGWFFQYDYTTECYSRPINKSLQTKIAIQ